MSDSDEDGVPDDIEISGIPMPSGEIVYPDPNNKHSDDDGLTDGEEVGTLVRNPATPACTPSEAVEYKFYFNIKSDPTKVDSDYDGYDDSIDFNPNNYDIVLYLGDLCELAQNYCVEHNLRDKQEQITLVL